jgi:CHAT domain-containing protein/predicted negative regulator of RcsB-dependent stress response
MTVTESLADWAKSLAQALVSYGQPPPQNLDERQRVALAWALKDYAVTAWSSVPGEVAIAASAIHALGEPVASGARAREELAAIAAWVDGIAELVRGGMTNALERLRRAIALFDSLRDEGSVAHVRASEVMALSILGHHEEAITVGERAKTQLIAVGDEYSAAKLSVNLGHALCQQGIFKDAIAHFEDAKTIFSKHNDARCECASEIGLADAYVGVGQMDRASASYHHALKLCETFHLRRDEALARESLALLQLARGNFSDALRSLEQARRSYEALGLTAAAVVVDQQQASVYYELNLLPEALKFLESVLSQYESLEMPVERAWAYLELARVRAALNLSREDIEVALAHAMELFDSEDVVIGQASAMLARAEYSLAGDRAEVALDLAEHADRLFTDIGHSLGSNQAQVTCAKSLLSLGRAEEAKSSFTKVLGQAVEHQLVSVQVSCFVGLGLVASAMGDEAAGRRHYESAISLFEAQRSSLPSDDLRAAFLADHLRPYREILRLNLFAVEDFGPEAVFTQLERYRARVLNERLRENAVPNVAAEGRECGPDGGNIESSAHDVERSRLNWLYRRIRRLEADGENAEPLVEESKRIEQNLLEYVRRERIGSIDGRTSPDASYGLAIDPLSIQSKLGPTRALIEYGILDDELFVCLVKSDGVSVQRNISHWPTAKAAIEQVRFQLGTIHYTPTMIVHHNETLLRRLKAALKQLHDLIWAPFAHAISECSELIVVPSEQLGSVQFAALHDGQSYLVERFALAVAASAHSALRGLDRNAVRPTSVLALGESSYLERAGAEAKFVAGLFPSATVLVGSEATTQAFRVASREVDVIHLACHGRFRVDNPAFSALHFVDAAFTAFDAESLRIRAAVVMLSACESGITQSASGDELLGLVRGFLIAGASRVVASLWAVDDVVTEQFVRVFYMALQGGDEPTIALRKAQLEIKRHWPLPSHWAPFVLYGGF